MILFRNPQNIEIFTSFVCQFEKVISDVLNDKTITICCINEQHKRFSEVATKNDPFATNTAFNPPFIAINEQVCQKLSLTQEEQYAMIAHEIGHILDNSPSEKNNPLNREYTADQFTIRLELSEELKTGLKKIINSGNYPSETESIKERIKKFPNASKNIKNTPTHSPTNTVDNDTETQY
jgi:Zn-dependent protease with chaperone function